MAFNRSWSGKTIAGTFCHIPVFPGTPALVWGEEQAFYVLDNTDSNYVS